MTAIKQTAKPLVMTYEDYLAEGEVMKRYDIIDGVREVTNPTEEHQDYVVNLVILFKEYGKKSGKGKAIVAPADILISRKPLRTRQPDVLFISHARRVNNRKLRDAAPLDPAPELVVEILSPSDTKKVLAGKLADYLKVNVLECWVVSPGARAVEVLDLSGGAVRSVKIYPEGETVTSVVFPDLMVAVADIFVE